MSVGVRFRAAEPACVAPRLSIRRAPLRAALWRGVPYLRTVPRRLRAVERFVLDGATHQGFTAEDGSAVSGLPESLVHSLLVECQRHGLVHSQGGVWRGDAEQIATALDRGELEVKEKAEADLLVAWDGAETLWSTPSRREAYELAPLEQAPAPGEHVDTDGGAIVEEHRLTGRVDGLPADVCHMCTPFRKVERAAEGYAVQGWIERTGSGELEIIGRDGRGHEVARPLGSVELPGTVGWWLAPLDEVRRYGLAARSWYRELGGPAPEATWQGDALQLTLGEAAARRVVADGRGLLAEAWCMTVESDRGELDVAVTLVPREGDPGACRLFELDGLVRDLQRGTAVERRPPAQEREIARRLFGLGAFGHLYQRREEEDFPHD